MFQHRKALSHTNSSTTTASAPVASTVIVESDLVVIMTVLLCASICVVGLITVARCAWLRGTSTGSGRSPFQATANKGLKKKVFQSLPKFTYSPDAISTPKYALECPICLAEFVEGDEVRVLPQCGHWFHVACVDMWLRSHSSCPSCRQILAVSRCHKCGNFPAISGAGTGTSVEVKTREENEAAATAASNL